MDMVLKTCETYAKGVELNAIIEFTNANDNLILYKCLFSNKNYQNKFDVTLKKRFVNTYRFSNHDINKFILLLPKGLDPYGTMVYR